MNAPSDNSSIKESIRENMLKNSDNLLVTLLTKQLDPSLEVLKKVQDALLEKTLEKLGKSSILWIKREAWSDFKDGVTTSNGIEIDKACLKAPLTRAWAQIVSWTTGELVIEFCALVKPSDSDEEVFLSIDLVKGQPSLEQYREKLVGIFGAKFTIGSATNKSAGFWRIFAGKEFEFNAHNAQHLAALAVTAGVCGEGTKLKLNAPDMSGLVDILYNGCIRYIETLDEMGWLVNE